MWPVAPVLGEKCSNADYYSGPCARALTPAIHETLRQECVDVVWEAGERVSAVLRRAGGQYRPPPSVIWSTRSPHSASLLPLLVEISPLQMKV